MDSMAYHSLIYSPWQKAVTEEMPQQSTTFRSTHHDNGWEPKEAMHKRELTRQTPQTTLHTNPLGTTTYVQLDQHFAIPRVHSGAVVTARTKEILQSMWHKHTRWLGRTKEQGEQKEQKR